MPRRAAVAGCPADPPRASVMLLGTFHFDDPGLDAHKPRHAFDVFSARRQSEIAEVVGLLAAYRPTKIAVERATSRPTSTTPTAPTCGAGRRSRPTRCTSSGSAWPPASATRGCGASTP